MKYSRLLFLTLLLIPLMGFGNCNSCQCEIIEGCLVCKEGCFDRRVKPDNPVPVGRVKRPKPSTFTQVSPQPPAQ